MKVPILVGMYTALRGIPFVPMPTWRVANLISVFQLFLRRSKLDATTRLLVPPILAFISYLFIHPLLTEVTGYNLASAFGVTVLLVFALLFQANTTVMNYYLVRCVRTSAYLLIIYQFIQSLLFLSGRQDLLFVLNDPSIIEGSNALRLVGGILGPPSFMGESGHIAVFIGPLFISLAILQKHGALRTPVLGYLAMIASLVLTLSGGAFLQLLFIAAALIMLQRNIIHRFAVITFLLICFFAITTFMSDYMNLISFKMAQLNSGGSSRQEGAEVFWNAFLSYPYFGIGADAIRNLSGDPNMLLPVMLAIYGLVGVSMIAVIVICTPCILALYSHNKMFLLPIFALFSHLSLAYGTITWPFIWVNFAIAISGFSLNLESTNSRKTSHPIFKQFFNG